jgi:hypothetical protein
MSLDAKEKTIALLSSTVFSVQAAASTTLYTVPTGKRCILDKATIVCGTAASTTAKVTIGASTATTDFLAENTLTNLAAQYDAVICRPVGATTPLKSKSYAAGTIIVVAVTTADVDGSTDCILRLFGTLYDA